MKRLISLLVALLSLTITAVAQNPTIEYGSPDELKGVSKIFIDAGTQMKMRGEIIKEIEKSKDKVPHLTIMDSPEESEVILVFAGDSTTRLAGLTTSSNGGGGAYSTSTYKKMRLGSGQVIKIVGQNRIRLLMDFEDEQKSKLFERRPSTNFARTFMKAYLKANGIK